MKNLEELFIQSKNPSIVWITAKFIEDKIGGQYYSTDYIEYERILKTNKLTVLKDVISEYNGGPMGFQLHSYDYLDQGVPVLRTKDMKELTIILDDPIFISQEKHNELKGSKTYPGDIIISKTGQIGVVAVVPKTLNEANLNQALCNIRVKEGIIDNYFLAVFLNSKYGQYQFIRQGEGKAVQNGLTKDEILDLQIPVISPEIQKYIGDKVRKAEELREEAKRLKKDAEEILSEKLNLKELLLKINKYIDKYNWISNLDIDDRIDALYYNPQKTIIRKFYNKKYDLQKLNALVDYKKGFAFKSEDYCSKNTNTLLLRVSDISNDEVNMDNMINLPDRFYQEYIDFNLLNEDIVLVVTGTTGKSVIINNSKSRLLLNQNALRMRLKDGVNVNPYYIELILQSQYFQILLKYSLYQSVQPFISMEFLNEVMIPIIDKVDMEEISNLYKKSLNNLFYAKQLIQEAKQDVEDLIEGNFDSQK